MDDDLSFSILGPLPPEVVEELNATPCESRCIFTREADCEDDDYFVPSQHNYIL